jgi:hypothetical protein
LRVHQQPHRRAVEREAVEQLSVGEDQHGVPVAGERELRREARVEMVARDAEVVEQGLQHVVGEAAELRLDARERRGDLAVDARRVDRDGPDGGLEQHGAEAVAAGERYRGSDCRVAAERDLGDRREVAHAGVPGIAPDRGIDQESGLGVADIRRYSLHVGVVERAGVEHDAGRIAALGSGREGGVAQH